ncbi:MAG TPA: helix-turn-helix domain-containing protein [Acidimicrobiales bacterium]|nr:helix-turn-helix domain-containing protein [Acidimicrobiales bacterium]
MAGSEAIPQLLTMDELAERLGVTHRHVRRLVAERRVPFLRVGRFIRFDPAQISAWLDQGRTEALRPML